MNGRMNFLLGNEGVGKGALLAYLIAKWTLGELEGDLKGTRVHVGIVGDEDDLDQVWTPRLYAAGADLDRVHQLTRLDGSPVVIGADRDQIAAKVTELGISVLYFDQLLDNLGADVDDWRQKQVREAVAPLRAMARELDIAVLATLHPNKRGKTFRELMSGTPAFNALSRSSLLLAQHPEDETRRVLARGKGNLSERPVVLEFVISSHVFPANGFEFNVPLVSDVRNSDLDLEDLIDVPAKQGVTKIATATELIEAMLPRDGLWHEAKPIYEAMAALEISESTTREAKDQLGVEHRRVGQRVDHRVEWRWTPKRGTPAGPTQAFSPGGVGGVGGVKQSPNGTEPTPPTPATPPDETTRTNPAGVRPAVFFRL